MITLPMRRAAPAGLAASVVYVLAASRLVR